MFNNVIFRSFRIKTNELLTDVVNYVVTKYNQSRLVFTTSSAYGQILFVFQNLANLIFYYIEDAITELNIKQATRKTSVYSLAAIGQYQPTRASGAIGEISLIVKDDVTINLPNNTVIIPNFTRILCETNNLNYLINLPQDSLIFELGNAATTPLNIIQGVIETQAFTGNGEKMQSFGVQYPKNYFIDNNLVRVFVNEEEWSKYPNLLQIPRDEPGFMERTGVTSGVDIFFGNENFGKVPIPGSEIRVDYVICDGYRGVINDISTDQVTWKFEETGLNVLGEDVDLNELFTIKTTILPNFGYNAEPLALTRLMLGRGSELLVVEDNYELMLKRTQQFSTVRAFRNQDDPRIFNLFLIPDINLRISTGETYFNIPESKFILTDGEKSELLKFIHNKGTMIVGNDVEILNPIIKRYVLNIALTVFDDTSQDIIKADVIATIVNYFLNLTRRNRVPKSDLISLVEAIEGVDSVNIAIVGEANENNNKTGATGLVGLDEFNDIIITDYELPIIRGGWSNRNGALYETGLSEEGLGAINIKIKEIVSSEYKNKKY